MSFKIKNLRLVYILKKKKKRLRINNYIKKMYNEFKVFTIKIFSLTTI